MSKHKKFKGRGGGRGNYDPLEEIGRNVEIDLSGKEKEEVDKPSRPPKKNRSRPKEGYRSLHR